ncbi:MAG: hypothetical protein II214_07065, partial [Alistipes sp.]|nr:hypothetical protein [Alistipes sp.]
MKRFLLSFVAVVGLLATSCVQDATSDMELNKQGVVTFAVDAQHTSRAYGDTYGGATEATQLYYAVYRDQELLEAISATNEPVLLTDGKASIELSLASGLEYEFVFWAASEAAIQDELYTIDWTTKAMTLNPAKLVTSDESLDAFYKYEKHTISSSNTYEVILKRPFAQINVATNDTAAAAAAGLVVAESWFEVSGAFTTLNLETGLADNVATLKYDVAKKPVAGNTVEANGVNYDLLGVIYVLANAEQSSLNNVKFQYNRAEGGEAVKTIEVPMTPIKRNARTNLVGKILTSDNNFEIEVDPNWGDSFEVDPSAYTTVAVDAASNEEAVVVYTDPTDATAPKKVIINNVAGLDWFAAQGKARTTEAVDASYKVVEQLNTNGGTFEGMVVELNADIDLANVNWTPIANFLGVFDGNNYTVSNVKIVVENNDPAGFFARAKYVQNLKLQNVSINAHYKAGAVVGDGLCSRIENCHVDGLTLEVTPDENKDNANHAGGIVGYLSAENEAYVKGCSVKNATIVAYRDVAAVVGTVNQKSEVVGNTAENVDVVANMLPEYAEQGKNANAGEIAGRVHEAATVENNTVTNVKVDVLKWENDTLSFGSATAFAIIGKYVSEGNDCEGKTIKLGTDVDLSASSWNPIGDNRTDTYFKGT